MNFRTSTRRSFEPINVTSLVDIVFNLLIFFMLTSSFSKSAGMEVQLPQAKTDEVQPSQKDVRLQMSKNGDVVYQGRILAVSEVQVLIKEAKEKEPTMGVLLEADKDVPHGRVIEVIDGIKQAGVSKLGIITAP